MSTQADHGGGIDTPPDRGYPVIDSAELTPVTRRRFRRPRRALHEIPRQPPGSVLVFQHGDTYELPPEGVLRLDSALVVEAVAVAVVSVRQTRRQIATYLATSDPRTGIALRAEFFCQVTDPQMVLDAGCWDADAMLHDHLNADRRLRFLAQSADLNRAWPHFHRNATARLIAYHDMHPLVVPGLIVRLTDIALEPQRFVTPPRPRGDSGPGHVPADPAGHDGLPGEVPPAADPWDGTGADGVPAFMPDNYTWGTDRERPR
jgi:hypothetical protein